MEHAQVPLSGTDRTRRFWERLKTVKARSVNDADSVDISTSAANPASTSTVVRVSVDITSEDINQNRHGMLSK